MHGVKADGASNIMFFCCDVKLRITSKIVLILLIGTVWCDRANKSSGMAVGSDEHNGRNDGNN
jgi:hypothetical protein